MREVESSLRNLRTDYIDFYFVHWPDAKTPRTSARTMMPTRMMLTFTFFLRRSQRTTSVSPRGTMPLKIE